MSKLQLYPCRIDSEVQELSSKYSLPLISHQKQVKAAFLTPNDKYLVTGSYDKTIRIWNTDTLKTEKVFHDLPSAVSALCFYKTKNLIVCGYTNGNICAYNFDQGEKFFDFFGHTNTISALVIADKIKILISASWDTTLGIWDLQGMRLIKKLEGHISLINSISLLHGSNLIASAGDDKELKIWDLVSLTLVSSATVYPWIISTIAVHKNRDDVLLGGSTPSIIQWSLSSNSKKNTLDLHTLSVTCIVFTNDYFSFITSSWDQTVLLWDFRTKQLLKVFFFNTETILSLIPSHNKNFFICTSRSGFLTLCSTKNEPNKFFKGHAGSVSAFIKISSDHIATGGTDTTIRIWDLHNNQESSILIGHLGIILSFALHCNKKILISSSEDRTLRFWEWKSSLILYKYSELEYPIYTIFSLLEHQTVLLCNSSNFLSFNIKSRSFTKIIDLKDTQFISASIMPSKKYFIACADFNIYTWKLPIN